MKPTRAIKGGALGILGPTMLLALAGMRLVSSADACTLDGKATALANNHRATITHTVVTEKTSANWAPFTFPGRYRTHEAISFNEDRALLAQVLSPGAVQHGWRWHFGDGWSMTGWQVTHKFVRPGTYRLTIEAYDTSWRQYYPFDSVNITIGR